MAAGLPASEARAEARLGIAVSRGLLLHVLATGDVAGADEAYERYLAGSAALHRQHAAASGEPGNPEVPG
jgi:hypothetical protein